MDQTQTLNSEETDAISAGLTDRLRGGFALVQTRFVTVEERARAQWIGIPKHARTAFDKLVERVRTSLDLPSRAEVQSLVERIEALDAKLAALAEGALAAPTHDIGAQKTTGKKATTGAAKPGKKKSADPAKGQRRAKIKDAAKRQKKSR